MDRRIINNVWFMYIHIYRCELLLVSVYKVVYENRHRRNEEQKQIITAVNRITYGSAFAAIDIVLKKV